MVVFNAAETAFRNTSKFNSETSSLESKKTIKEMADAIESVNNPEFKNKMDEITRTESEINELKNIQNQLKGNILKKVTKKLSDNQEFTLYKYSGDELIKKDEIYIVLSISGSFAAGIAVPLILGLHPIFMAVGLGTAFAAVMTADKARKRIIIPERIIDKKNEELEKARNELKSIPEKIIKSLPSKPDEADCDEIVDESDFVSVGGIKLNKRKEAQNNKFLSYLFSKAAIS